MLQRKQQAQPRVLFVSSSSGNGGADRLPVDLAQGLQERGVSLLFACRTDQFTEAECRTVGIATVGFNICNSGDLRAAQALSRLMRKRSIDIVHVHARRDFMVAALAGRLARLSRQRQNALPPRIVLHTHLLRVLGEPPGLAGRFFQASTDAVIAVSGAVAAFLNANHGLRPGFVRTIPNGVALERYALPQSAQAHAWRQALRREWGIPDDALVIGTVGRLFQKGQSFLFAAVPALLARFPELRIVLVGPERDPDDERRLRERAARWGFADRVIFAGVRSDIPACMAAFDLLAHLPYDEAFGLVLAEAMASGLPTVATDAGGCREVVADGRTGLLVPWNDALALEEALASLLEPEHGPQLRRTLGKAASHAANDFSRARQIDHLLNLYSELCDSAKEATKPLTDGSAIG